MAFISYILLGISLLILFILIVWITVFAYKNESSYNIPNIANKYYKS